MLSQVIPSTLFTDSVYVGIDPVSRHKSFVYAALDRGLNLVALADGEMEDVMAFLSGQVSAVVAVNAPSHVNHGLVKKNLEQQSLAPHQIRGVDMRVSERELLERGIAVSRTASRESLCPARVQMGFELYRKLSKLGFKSQLEEGASHQWLETHPQAAFCVLLGENPLQRSMVEGRLQRALLLYEHGVRINDPMDFFEEVTRHKLIHGDLPMELVYLPEQLDALVAAYTAWLTAERPNAITRIGHKQEGFITLPVSSLKERY
ncbi:MAG: DUF429 domain-containing protein [Chloroflexi bacterium]|nr:DUF429 domain-containing protein [Chloroflexota bacterium]